MKVYGGDDIVAQKTTILNNVAEWVTRSGFNSCGSTQTANTPPVSSSESYIWGCKDVNAQPSYKEKAIPYWENNPVTWTAPNGVTGTMTGATTTATPASNTTTTSTSAAAAAAAAAAAGIRLLGDRQKGRRLPPVVRRVVAA